MQHILKERTQKQSCNTNQPCTQNTFLSDGKFIDSKTRTINVDLVTYNAQEDLFCLCAFSFEWQTSGRIKWDYKFNSGKSLVHIMWWSCLHLHVE